MATVHALFTFSVSDFVIASRHEPCMLQCVALCRALFDFETDLIMKYRLSKRKLKNKKYKIKKEKDIIAENTAKMSSFMKDVIDTVLNS